MNMPPILGLDSFDYDYVTRVGGECPAVLTAEEWAALMAPVTVEVLDGDEALALAVEADETAARWLTMDFE